MNEDSVFVDINECLVNPCDGGRCKNTFGSFMCTCDNGYVVDETGLKCVGKSTVLNHAPTYQPKLPTHLSNNSSNQPPTYLVTCLPTHLLTHATVYPSTYPFFLPYNDTPTHLTTIRNIYHEHPLIVQLTCLLIHPPAHPLASLTPTHLPAHLPAHLPT